MALPALQSGVRTGEGKCRLGMIKRCRLPPGSTVAHLALLRDSSSSVIGIVCIVVIAQVAGNTCGGSQVEIAAAVALIALQLRVAAGQRESH